MVQVDDVKKLGRAVTKLARELYGDKAKVSVRKDRASGDYVAVVTVNYNDELTEVGYSKLDVLRSLQLALFSVEQEVNDLGRDIQAAINDLEKIVDNYSGGYVLVMRALKQSPELASMFVED